MRKRMVTLVAGAIVLAGCGGGVEGQAVAGERWDPCSITPEALAATGLDPAYRDEGWGQGVSVSEWARCEFMTPGGASAYALSVLSSREHTVAEARADPGNREGRDVDVGSRDAYLYKTEFGPDVTDCKIALEVPPGVVVFTVFDQGGRDVDPCGAVLEHAEDLETSLPAAK